MTKLPFLLTFFFLPLLCLANYNVDSLLRVFDAEIDRESVYVEQKEYRLRGLRSLRESITDPYHQFDITSQLIREFSFYNYDSAHYYTRHNQYLAHRVDDRKYRFEAEMQSVYLNMVNGKFAHVANTLNFLRGEEPDSASLNQIGLAELRMHYYENSDYSIRIRQSPPTGRLRQLLGHYAVRPHLIEPHDWDIRFYLYEDANRDADAYTYLKEMFLSQPPGSKPYSFFGVRLSKAAALRGDTDEADHYLILSAISDRKGVIRNGMATYHLARRMFERGDIQRAYRYTNLVLDHANLSNSYLNKIHISELLGQIHRAYTQDTAHDQAQLMFAFSVVFVLLVILLAAFVLLRVQMRRLASAQHKLVINYRTELDLNRRLNRLSAHLEDNNRVKEEYIGVFLGMRPLYLDSAQEYLNTVMKHLKAGRIAELGEYTRRQITRLKEVERTYHEFDTMFLDLFPSFIDQFNALLEPDSRFSPPPGELTIELRIFALVRLGITDSQRIAGYLRYSVSTIYNYRSRVRSRAIGPKDEFEQQVAAIGCRPANTLAG